MLITFTIVTNLLKIIKTILLVIALLSFIPVLSQIESEEDVVISEKQNDDIYIAGETVHIDAPIKGDAILAAGKITVKDSIQQDLIVAGGTITVNGYVGDDIHIAGGSVTIDSEVGDDLVIFGGEVIITRDAIIHGNLVAYAGDINSFGKINGGVKAYAGDLKINGTIAKEVKIYAADVIINGEIKGPSKIVAESIEIGPNAKFYEDVRYWSEGGEINFGDSLMNVKANFDPTIREVYEGFSLKNLGVAALGMVIFYILSTFLIVWLLNSIFKRFFSKVITDLKGNIPLSLGYGFIYIIGLPILIFLIFVIVIGIPIGIFLLFFYLFSLLFGHLIVALLTTHYLNSRNNKKWNFWSIVFLALAIAILIRLITFIPILGSIISIVIIAGAYGLISVHLFKNINPLKIK